MPSSSSFMYMSAPAMMPDRAHSRASSIASASSFRSRAPSPSLRDNPVSLRTHISTLKHNIRQQQAQLHALEGTLHSQRVPSAPSPSSHHPLNTSVSFDSMAYSPSGRSTPNDASSPSSYRSPSQSFANGASSPSAEKLLKAQRRTSSFEILQTIAGPDSFLPLPSKRDSVQLFGSQGIREGQPADFSSSTSSNGGASGSRRAPSPTRTLSRIPVSSVGHARTLAEEGQTNQTPSRSNIPTPLDASTSSSYSGAGNDSFVNLSSASLQLPPSPNGLNGAGGNRRISLGTTGNTSKVLADLQAGVINARTALENTKAQLRLSQRTVAQLTRQTEDLKDGRERLRLENEGLNNVVARKERLLQEVLERARKAEAEAANLKAQLKTETTQSKKSIREMEAQVSQSNAVSQKSEREVITLRDSIKQLSVGWKQELESVKNEVGKREEKCKKEAEEIGRKYVRLLELVKEEREERTRVQELRDAMDRLQEEWEGSMKGELKGLHDGVQRSEKDSAEANKIAQDVSNELQRLRSMIRAVSRTSISSSIPAPTSRK